MILALQSMDPTVEGILWLIAVVLFVIAAWLVRDTPVAAFVPLGLAFFVFVFMWNAFAAT